MDALVIDAFEFCRLKEHRTGKIQVADLPRLAQESVGQAGSVDWSLQGGYSSRGHPQLVLKVDGSVRLMCQRCLTPFDSTIDSGATLVLAPDEGSADEMDAMLADENVEVIVGSHEFSIAELVEDDALLAVPLAPKHETCPDQLAAPLPEGEKKPSPFAVLKDLKKS
ncbi:YceD family protein [Noviherbaspirillum galbum]|nr:DUF177 domain-containing protein [Noviherbaspirillum galbum]